MAQCRAAIGARCDVPPVGPGVVDRRRRLRAASPPSSRRAAPTAPTSPVWTTVSPSVNVAPDSSSPETNCDEADASISTVPPATEPVPCTRNGSASPSSAHAETAHRVEQGGDGPGPGLLVAVERDDLGAERGDRRHEAQHRARQAAVDGARPGAGAIAPPTVSSVPAPSSDTPSVRSAPIIRSVSRLRSAPLTVDVPCGVASAASTSARLVCDFEPGTVTVACTGVVVRRCRPRVQGIHRRPSCLVGDVLPPWDTCVGDSR